MIKKAIIADAGRATRFLPLSKAYPKSLFPILNRPAIQVLVEELLGAGITEIAHVRMPGCYAVEDYFSSDQGLENYLNNHDKNGLLAGLEEIRKKVNFQYFSQSPDLPYGSGSPLLAVGKFIPKEPFLYLYADDLILENTSGLFIKKMISTYQKMKPAAVVGVKKIPPRKVPLYGVIKFKDKKTGQIEKIVEKPVVKKAPSCLTVFGRFILTPQIIDHFNPEKVVPGKELQLYNALDSLIEKKLVLVEELKEGEWLTIGEPGHWLEANNAFYDHQA